MALYRKRVPERPVDSDGSDGLQLVIGPEELMVVGPAGRHSRVIPSFGNTLSLTEPVTEAAGRAQDCASAAANAALSASWQCLPCTTAISRVLARVQAT